VTIPGALRERGGSISTFPDGLRRRRSLFSQNRNLFASSPLERRVGSHHRLQKLKKGARPSGNLPVYLLWRDFLGERETCGLPSQNTAQPFGRGRVVSVSDDSLSTIHTSLSRVQWTAILMSLRRCGITGSKLTIACRAAERMGGSIGFESELGKGSKFWIQLKKS
jgi:hypothetical protein